MWYLNVHECTILSLLMVRKVAVIIVRGMQLWLSVFRNFLLLNVEVHFLVYASFRSLKHKASVKLPSAVLTCSLLLDKLGNRMLPIVFSFKILRKLESVQDSAVIAKSSSLGYWQLTALIWMVALVLYLQNTSTWVVDQGVLFSPVTPR